MWGPLASADAAVMGSGDDRCSPGIQSVFFRLNNLPLNSQRFLHALQGYAFSKLRVVFTVYPLQ